MGNFKVKLKRLLQENKGNLKMPAYATAGSAGVDLQACLVEDINLQPGEIVKVPTGWALELPGPEVVALVFARSGLATKHGIALANGVGVIDSDYRGELQVALVNHGREPFAIRNGDRVAQMVFMPVMKVQLEEVQELSATARGAGGFGSTGV